MGYLRHKVSGAVTDDLVFDSIEFQTLVKQVFATQQTVQGQTGAGGTTGGFTIPAGSKVWEEINETDAGLPDPPGGRVIVLPLGSAATAAAETSSEEWVPEVAGALTDVEYVPNGNITGQATNNRVLTLQQVQFSGTATVTRTVQALAALTFGNGTNASQNQSVPLVISTAAFQAQYPLEVVSSVNGTGLADPGGVVYAVYTRS